MNWLSLANWRPTWPDAGWSLVFLHTYILVIAGLDLGVGYCVAAILLMGLAIVGRWFGWDRLVLPALLGLFAGFWFQAILYPGAPHRSLQFDWLPTIVGAIAGAGIGAVVAWRERRFKRQ